MRRGAVGGCDGGHSGRGCRGDIFDGRASNGIVILTAGALGRRGSGGLRRRPRGRERRERVGRRRARRIVHIGRRQVG